MPQRSTKFQRLVFLIQRALSGTATVRESAMMRDRISGEEREVDILITSTVGPHRVEIGVECVEGNRPATVEWVERQWAKHVDLTDKLILVAKRGFTRSAKKKAKLKRIDTYTLSEVLDNPGVLRRNFDALTMIRTDLETERCIIRGLDSLEGVEGDPVIYREDGQPIGTVNSIWGREFRKLERTDWLHTAGQSGQRHWMLTFALNEPCYVLAAEGRKVRVTHLDVPAEVVRTEVPVSLEHGTFAGYPISHGEVSKPIPGQGVLLVGNEDGTIKILHDYGGDDVQEI